MNIIKIQSTVSLLALLLALSNACAATYYVATTGNDTNSGMQLKPFLSIGKGISTAANGDTIQVASGTYFEVITWTNKSLAVRGTGPGQSILNTSNSGSRPHTLANVPPTATIEGLTFIWSGLSLIGGAPTINHCAFTQSSVALSNQGSSPMVNDTTFSDNSSTGMHNDAGSSPSLNRCTFTNNNFHAILNLGGHVALNNCAIIDNVPDGVFNSNGAMTANNCLFSKHPEAFHSVNGSSTFYNCIFYNNSYGLSNYGSTMKVYNSILWSNMTEIYTAGTTPIVTYSDVQGGFAGTGNINVDPLFVNPSAGDFHLQPASPCINAGSATVPNLPATDFVGSPRIVGGAPDMGAYESIAGSWFVDAAFGNDANAGTPTAPFATVTAAFNIAASGQNIHIKQGNYGNDRPRMTKSLRLFNWGSAGLARIGKP